MGESWGTMGGRCAAAIILLIALCGPASAAPLRLSLSECIQRALAENPDLLEKRWDITLAENRVEEARNGFLPKANVLNLTGFVSGAKGQVWDPPPEGFTTSNRGDIGPFTRVLLEFTQPLYTFGKLTAGRNAAEKGLEAANAKQAESRDEVVVSIKTLYSQVLLSRTIAELLGEVVENFQKAIDEAEKRLEDESSKVTQSDVLKLKIGLAGVAKEVPKARNGAELGRDALARAVGLNASTEFDVTDERLEPLPAKLKTLEEYTADVFRLSPQWRQLEAGLGAREELVKVEEADFFPKIFLVGGFRYGYAPTRDRQLSPFADDQFNFLQLPGAALGMFWSLDFWETERKVDGARAEFLKLQQTRANAQTGIRLAVKKAYLDATQAREAVEIADKGRKAARSLLVGNMSGFELGVGEAKDVFEALVIYTTATSNFYSVVNDYNVSLAELTKTVGQEVCELKY
jgi:outer membrane protein